jgi:glycosyltransferase involved in cell wall biosynthesis
MPLQVCGKGPLADQLEGTEQLGWLDRTAWRRALRRARALILTPLWQEPFGIAGLESLAEGTPVVGWCTGGMADWQGAGVFHVPVGDTGRLSELLAQLATDDERVRLAGHAGWRRVRKRPAPAHLHAQLEAVYASLDSL